MRARIAGIGLAALPLLTGGAAHPLTPEGAIDVAPGPYLVATNPVTDRVYVASTTAGMVTRIDMSTVPPETVAIPVAPGPYGIDVNPVTGKVYVGSLSGTVTVIDDSGDEPHVYPVPFPVPGAAGVAVDPVTNRVYVASFADGLVAVIDGVTDDSAGPPIPIGPKKSFFLLEVNPVLGRLYVPEWPGSKLHVVDLRSPLGPTKTSYGPFPPVPTPFGPVTSLGGVAIHPLTQDVYVTNEKGALYLLDARTHALEGMTAVGVPGVLPFGTWGVEVNPVTNRVYVAQFHSDSVHAFDAFSLEPHDVEFTGIPDGDPDAGPHFTAFDPVRGTLYVTNEFAGTVSLFTDPAH